MTNEPAPRKYISVVTAELLALGMERDWPVIMDKVIDILESHSATKGHMTLISLLRMGFFPCHAENPNTVYISVDLESEAAGWPPVVQEIQQYLREYEYADLHVHLEHNTSDPVNAFFDYLMERIDSYHLANRPGGRRRPGVIAYAFKIQRPSCAGAGSKVEHAPKSGLLRRRGSVVHYSSEATHPTRLRNPFPPASGRKSSRIPGGHSAIRNWVMRVINTTLPAMIASLRHRMDMMFVMVRTTFVPTAAQILQCPWHSSSSLPF